MLIILWRHKIHILSEQPLAEEAESGGERAAESARHGEVAVERGVARRAAPDRGGAARPSGAEAAGDPSTIGGMQAKRIGPKTGKMAETPQRCSRKRCQAENGAGCTPKENRE